MLRITLSAKDQVAVAFERYTVAEGKPTPTMQL